MKQISFATSKSNEPDSALTEAQQEYDHRRQQDRHVFDEAQRASIVALAQDFPRLWRDPATDDQDRKRMIRLLVEDVTMLPQHTNLR